MAQGIEPYNEKQAKKRALIGAIVTAAAGAVAGAAGGSANTVANTMFLAYSIAPTVTKLWVANAITSWDRLQEFEADQLGLKYMLDRNYDVPPGKMLDPSQNATQRADAAQKKIAGAMAPEIQAKLDAGELIGNSAEFEAVMAGITRDNGVRAYHFDMFKMARENLEESLRIRSNDPYAHYYYGKILKLTARTSQEKLRALGEFAQAIQLDRRKVIAEPHLYRALSMIDGKDPNQMQEIVIALKDYVAIYQREHSGGLPPNMEVIYDYMQEAGEASWTATPAVNVSTRGIDPIAARMEATSRPAPASDTQTTGAPEVQTPKPAPKRRP